MRTLAPDQRVRHRFVLLSYPISLVSEEDVRQRLLPKRCDKLLLGASRNRPSYVNVLCLRHPAFDNKAKYFEINNVHPTISIPCSDQDVLDCVHGWASKYEAYVYGDEITDQDVTRTVGGLPTGMCSDG